VFQQFAERSFARGNNKCLEMYSIDVQIVSANPFSAPALSIDAQSVAISSAISAGLEISYLDTSALTADTILPTQYFLSQESVIVR
jgi:hypothetical protein